MDAPVLLGVAAVGAPARAIHCARAPFVAGGVDAQHAVAAEENLADYTYARHKRQEWTDEEIWPQPFVTGDDLVALGFAPGPRFKEILSRVEDEQLEGRLVSREAALEFVKREWPS